MIAQSAGLTPAARTRISTWSSPMLGLVDIPGLDDLARAVPVLHHGLHRWPPFAAPSTAYGVRFVCTAYATVYGVRCQGPGIGSLERRRKGVTVATNALPGAEPRNRLSRERVLQRRDRPGRCRRAGRPQHAQARRGARGRADGALPSRRQPGRPHRRDDRSSSSARSTCPAPDPTGGPRCTGGPSRCATRWPATDGRSG